MGWRIIQQPNGLLARFDTIVDDFTDYDMTEESAIRLCMEEYEMERKEAKKKVQRGINAGIARFDEAIDIIEAVHGEKRAKEAVKEMSEKIDN